MQTALGRMQNFTLDAPGPLMDKSMDVDAFIDSLLMQDAIPLTSDLVPSALAKGLGIFTDGSFGQQGSNGRQQTGSKPSQPTTGPGAAGPSSTPGVNNRSNDGGRGRDPTDPRATTEAEKKIQQLQARVMKLEQQGGLEHQQKHPVGQDGQHQQQQAASEAQLHQQQAMAAYNNQQMSRQVPSGMYGMPSPQIQAQQQMQLAYAQQQQQQQQAYMQAAYQQQAQQSFNPYSSWAPSPYSYNPFYGMQYGMQQYAQAMAASMAAAAASPADPTAPPNINGTSPPAPNTQITEGGASDGEDEDEARAVKKPRLIWTNALHKRFLEAVVKCGGVERALPKAIMKEMDVVGLTRENVASHLQKYRQRHKKDDGDDEDRGDRGAAMDHDDGHHHYEEGEDEDAAAEHAAEPRQHHGHTQKDAKRAKHVQRGGGTTLGGRQQQHQQQEEDGGLDDGGAEQQTETAQGNNDRAGIEGGECVEGGMPLAMQAVAEAVNNTLGAAEGGLSEPAAPPQ